MTAYRPLMKTDIFESDPFSGSKGAHLASIDTDYRFEKNDEVFLNTGGRRLKVRITYVRLEWNSDGLTRELLAMKL